MRDEERNVALLEDCLAGSLGLQGLATGKHIVRDERGWREGVFFVRRMWSAHIAPSFHPLATICHAETTASEYRGRKSAAWRRSAIAIAAEDPEQVATHAVVETSEDRVTPLLCELSLPPDGDPHLTLDGIAYSVEWCGCEFEMSLRFANPTLAALINLEAALADTAEEIAEHSGNATVAQYVELWRGYRSRG